MNTPENTTKKLTANELACQIFAHFPERRKRSAWDRGVNAYMDDLLSDFGNLKTEAQEWTRDALEAALMNGADSWYAYSNGGNALISNYDIAKRLCTPSMFKKKREGELDPHSDESWLSWQACALYQASRKIISIAREAGLLVPPVKNKNNEVLDY